MNKKEPKEVSEQLNIGEEKPKRKSRAKVAIVGHVDHGKTVLTAAVQAAANKENLDVVVVDSVTTQPTKEQPENRIGYLSTEDGPTEATEIVEGKQMFVQVPRTKKQIKARKRSKLSKRSRTKNRRK